MALLRCLAGWVLRHNWFGLELVLLGWISLDFCEFIGLLGIYEWRQKSVRCYAEDGVWSSRGRPPCLDRFGWWMNDWREPTYISLRRGVAWAVAAKFYGRIWSDLVG